MRLGSKGKKEGRREEGKKIDFKKGRFHTPTNFSPLHLYFFASMSEKLRGGLKCRLQKKEWENEGRNKKGKRASFQGRESQHFKPRKDCKLHLAYLFMSLMKYEHFIWHLRQICWKKNEAIEVERHRLSDWSRVTKLVSVGAQARSQPTYSVSSHPLLALSPTPGWLRKEGEEREWGQRRGMLGEVKAGWGEGESKFVCQLSASLVTFFSLSRRKVHRHFTYSIWISQFPHPNRDFWLAGDLAYTALGHHKLRDPGKVPLAWLTYANRLLLA